MKNSDLFLSSILHAPKFCEFNKDGYTYLITVLAEENPYKNLEKMMKNSIKEKMIQHQFESNIEFYEKHLGRKISEKCDYIYRINLEKYLDLDLLKIKSDNITNIGEIEWRLANAAIAVRKDVYDDSEEFLIDLEKKYKVSEDNLVRDWEIKVIDIVEYCQK